MIDIPTALTPSETRLLQILARGVVVAEAGALLGYSTVALAHVAQQVVSIDPHNGYPHHAPRPTYEPFLNNLRRHGVLDRVRAVRGDARRELPRLEAAGVFLDLTGEAELTRACITAAEKTGARWIAVHDYARGGCAGATKVIDHLIRSGRWHASRVDTLVVLAR